MHLNEIIYFFQKCFNHLLDALKFFIFRHSATSGTFDFRINSNTEIWLLHIWQDHLYTHLLILVSDPLSIVN